MITTIPTCSELFGHCRTIASALFDDARSPWEPLDDISSFVASIGPTLPESDYRHLPHHIYIAKSARIAPNAHIAPYTIIDVDAEIRHCAFIRGSAIVGKRSVVGNSCELKNCILFDDVQVPHFSYVGDSILGWKAHLGAGAVTSNLKSDKSPIVIRIGEDVIRTGRKKLGAILGDCVEIGCNAVLCPGTIIGRNTTVYPLSRVRGVIPADSIFKSADHIVRKH